MKVKMIIILTLICFLVLFINQGQIKAQELELNAKSAILIETDTEQVLFEKNIDEELPPASITKIMTLLIAMEEVEDGNISLDDEITVSQNAASMGGSQIYLAANDRVPFRDLIKAVAIASANDASVAIAEAISGSYSGFISLMNERAEELGMENTNFVNSTGLPDDEHYTTAEDIVKMSKELVKYEEILEWSSIWVDYIELPDREAMVANTNKLINEYQGMDGLKTGHTSEAGYCLTATARREDTRLISVVLDSETEEDRRNDTDNLLNYGFNNFEKKLVVEEGERIDNIEISSAKNPVITAEAAENLHAMIERGASSEIEEEIRLQQSLTAPLEEGEVIGEILVKKDDDILNSVDIVTSEDIEKANVFIRLWRRFVNWIGGWLQSL
ncbi:MAG: D-alanyl-D-alanine carboxypeptidase family protein [Halanaerobiales bacterium]